MPKPETLKLKFNKDKDIVELEENSFNKVIDINESEKIIRSFLNYLREDSTKRKVINRTSRSFWQRSLKNK